VKTLLALALAAGCIGEKPKMTPSAAPDPMQEALWRDFEGRADRPVTDRIPSRGSDGIWRSPDGKPITWTGVIGWTRPPQQDGAPYTAYYCADERRYWVHQGSALGSTEFWFGPFALDR